MSTATKNLIRLMFFFILRHIYVDKCVYLSLSHHAHDLFTLFEYSKVFQ